MPKRIKAEPTRELCGGICDMTLRRWMDLRGFPRPIYIGRVRYWREDEVAEWLEAQADNAA